MKTQRSPLFIFELANNHQGDVRHGRRIIDEMAKIARQFGIRAAVKLQYRNLATFIHPAFRTGDHKHIKRFLSTELTKESFVASNVSVTSTFWSSALPLFVTVIV